jgi:hypothetical protein
MTNKIPQEIEEKILKDVFDDLWDYRWNQNYEEANKMLRIAIQKGFKAGQKQTNEEVLKLIERLKVRVIVKGILSEEWYLNFEELKSKLTGDENDK